MDGSLFSYASMYQALQDGFDTLYVVMTISNINIFIPNFDKQPNKG